MATIRIPTPLRPQVDNQEILATLTGKYPELGKRLFKTDNELNRFINVYVNDEDIRFLENLDTPLKANDEVSIVPAIAGG